MKFKHLFKLKEHTSSTYIFEADDIIMRLDFIKDILRVSLIKDKDNLIPTWSICPKGYKMPIEGRDKLSLESLRLEEVTYQEDEDVIRFRHCGYLISVELMNFRITISNEKGILYQDRNGLAYNFKGELGDGSLHYTRRDENQRIYGLGDKSGHINKNHQSFILSEVDSMGFKAAYSDPLYKHVPFYICDKDIGTYGIYYDTYSNGRIDFGKEHDNYFEPYNFIQYEEENMVFYIFFGGIKEIIRNFNYLTGGISDVPTWAFKYCGSTMEYTDAPNAEERLKEFVYNLEDNKISAGGFYMSSGYTQIGDKRYVFHWNKDKIADPKELSTWFNEKGLKLIPNIKPAFLNDHPLYEKIASKGWFLHYKDGSPALFPFWGGMASYLDFTNIGAFNFWKECVRNNLVDLGYSDIWNDNNEYDVLDKDIYADGFGKKIQARLIRPLFSLLMATASRQASEEAGNVNPFIISRCAPVGMQRVATTWTGDNYTSFEELRYNHYQAMTMSLSGFSFFGQDIGGFYGPSPDRELFIRWLQYGVFTPRFVLHSWKVGEPSTMPWLYPDMMDEVRKIFNLRESLIPYLKSQYELCIKNNDPLIKPVFLRQADYDRESDYFMCGNDIFVCPLFDKGVDSLNIKLPRSDKGWRLRDSGEIIKGDTEINITCTIKDLPIWFREVD